MTLPTLTDLIAEVRVVAQEMPDHVSVFVCTYSVQLDPRYAIDRYGCIFGHAARRLAERRGTDTLDAYDGLDGNWISGIYSEAGESLRQWAASVQASNDGHLPWGYSVALADSQYPIDISQ